MNFRAVGMLTKVLFLVIFLVCFSESFLVIPLKNFKSNAKVLQSSQSSVGSSGGSKNCAHPNSTFGKRENGDLQTYVEKIEKSKNWMGKKVVVEVNYPSGKTENHCDITYILVENINQNCGCKKEKVELKGGGPHFKYFNISITSDSGCSNEHKIYGYTNC